MCSMSTRHIKTQMPGNYCCCLCLVVCWRFNKQGRKQQESRKFKQWFRENLNSCFLFWQADQRIVIHKDVSRQKMYWTSLYENKSVWKPTINWSYIESNTSLRCWITKPFLSMKSNEFTFKSNCKQNLRIISSWLKLCIKSDSLFNASLLFYQLS